MYIFYAGILKNISPLKGKDGGNSDTDDSSVSPVHANQEAGPSKPCESGLDQIKKVLSASQKNQRLVSGHFLR